MMPSFAASRLRGRARDGSLAAIMVVLPGLGRFHRGTGLFVMASPKPAALAEGHSAARERLGAARVRHSRQKKPRSGVEGRASERAIPLGRGI